MKSTLAIALLVISLAGCSYRNSSSSAAKASEAAMSEDDKHRLYSAALAASESPLDSDTFKEVCQKIGIFNRRGQPNDQYMAFVAAHVKWATRIDTQQFKREINTTENARVYLNKYLPR
jgi:PBP1b-binding outer membrane lipoprotein LpoB